ncbi:hypothetical protein BHQ19_08355 [Mycolicibacterium porcinum]|nr:hypothetical protein BHQ19_08355 [Mycolicibacterium porcinum]
MELTEETCNEADDFEADATRKPIATEERAVRRARRPIVWLTYGVIPALIVGLAACAGYLQWRNSSMRAAQAAAISAVPAATDSTIKMLSYKPDTVQKDLESASEGLTGAFRDSYNSLTHDVVIPGAQQKQISAVATVPGAAAVSASAKRAVVIVFVNQTTIVGADPPTATASTIRVTLDKVGERWLVSDFTPI